MIYFSSRERLHYESNDLKTALLWEGGGGGNAANSFDRKGSKIGTVMGKKNKKNISGKDFKILKLTDRYPLLSVSFRMRNCLQGG